ncbi:MAG: hypothetical protein KDE27_13920 [Planctomycetes bacterium]|nr:hypothetical protein [Planctomycetota bacterium]
MDKLQVKKIVAVCFLEAVRMTLDHLGTYRMQMAAERSEELPKRYGEVRRLRDYLQRCAGSYQDLVEIDLADDDVAMLVSCCRRYVEAIDQRLEGPGVDERERKLLKKKQQLVADWTVELAAKPLFELPLPGLVELPGEGSRALKIRIQNKLYGTGQQQLIRQGHVVNVGATLGSSPIASEPSESQGTVPVIDLVDRRSAGVPNAPLPLPLLDSAAVQDPRLRSLVLMNLRSLEVAEAAKDYRLATMLLAAVLETVVIDYAIQRRGELELNGAADTWEARELLLGILGASATHSDRMLAHSLFSARSLLNPAQQILAPVVATSSSLECHRDFVKAMLHQLGFGMTSPERSGAAEKDRAQTD